MYENILVETGIIEKTYSEYLKLIDYYRNVKRPSIFGRYLNINVDHSVFDIGADVVFDRYGSGVRYDVYDYTPFYYTSQVINDAASNMDLKGQMFNGYLNVTTYSIEKPRIEDLVVFSYPPQDGTEIFRVSTIRASLNAMNSTPGLNWNELTLEYAPLIDIQNLNFLNRYVYSLAEEQYMLYDKFSVYIKQLEKLSQLFKIMQKTFNNTYEGYVDQNNIIPLEANNVIYEFLTKAIKYNKYFETSYRPFIVKNYSAIECIDLNGSVVDCPEVIITTKGILDYNDSINIYDLAALVKQWEF